MKLAVALTCLLATETANAFSVTPQFRGIAKVSKNTAVGKLYGLLDEINSDNYNLMGASSDESSEGLNDAFEMFLADLVLISV